MPRELREPSLEVDGHLASDCDQAPIEAAKLRRGRLARGPDDRTAGLRPSQVPDVRPTELSSAHGHHETVPGAGNQPSASREG